MLATIQTYFLCTCFQKLASTLSSFFSHFGALAGWSLDLRYPFVSFQYEAGDFSLMAVTSLTIIACIPYRPLLQNYGSYILFLSYLHIAFGPTGVFFFPFEDLFKSSQ